MTTEVLSYQFDDVVIDLRAGRVLKGGLPVALEPKAYDLLVLLASRSGELVTKQDVLDRVWSGVYVTDNAVARVVAQLRRALGDAARGARYIETVPTRGYRFIVPVTRQQPPPPIPGRVEVAPGTASPDQLSPAIPFSGTLSGSNRVPTPAATSLEHRPTPHPLWAAALAAVALVALIFAWRSSQDAPAAAVPVLQRTQVTSSAALDAFPAWSPDGSVLVYASDRSGQFELFIRDLAAGGDRLALTSDRQHNVQPCWSPDGAHIAYHSRGRGGIWIIPRTGGTPRQISRFGSRPAWSPDGTRVAFQGAPYTEPGAAAFETFGPSSLWIADLAGGEPRRVTAGWRPEGSHTRPTWFPDGQRLFFASQALGNTTFWTVDLPTGATTRVLDAGARALDVTLTPDGRAAYYVRLDAHFDLWKLLLMADGRAAGEPQLVMQPSELDVRHVAVHPRDGQLAYVAMATVAGLRSLPVSGEGVPSGPSIRVAEDAVRSARRPSFSPDGRLVAFERQSAGLPPALWLLDLVQGSGRLLTRHAEGTRDPAWSTDGREVYFETGSGDTRALRAVGVETGGTRLVAALNERGRELLRPRVSPDGRQLAYTRSEDGQLEVVIRPIGGGAETRVARIGDGAAFPVWSPDGRALAVDVWNDGHAQVHVVDLGSRTSVRVSHDVDQAWVRSWSPDGRQVAFAGAKDGRWNVWAAHRDGTRQRQLTNYGDEHHYVRNPEWSPRGERLVYEFASFSGNVWVVTVK